MSATAFRLNQGAEAYEVITGKKKEPFLGVLLTYGEMKEQLSYKVEFPTVHHPSSTVKLGVLGAGLFANAALLPAIKKIPGIELVGIASVGGLHAQHSAKKFRFAFATSSDEEIINDPKINTVAILTRHDSHSNLVLKALQAGKHVFVEKPLAINNGQLSAISKQLTADDCPLLTVGFNRRFAPLASQLATHFANRTEALYMHYRINAGLHPAQPLDT